MTEHEIIVAMAKAMAQADGVPVESMPPSMTFGGVDYLGTARRQFYGMLAFSEAHAWPVEKVAGVAETVPGMHGALVVEEDEQQAPVKKGKGK